MKCPEKPEIKTYYGSIGLKETFECLFVDQMTLMSE